MDAFSVFYALWAYAAVCLFTAGVAYRMWDYARRPAPLKIPTTPAPVTSWGVVARQTREIVFFESLFKANGWTWLFGWLFHAGLLVVLLRHLRYFTEPVWIWVVLLQPIGIYAGLVMAGGLAMLLLRRFAVPCIRFISAPSDYLHLALLLAIAGSGLLMTYVAHTDIVATKAFILGLLYLDWQPIPKDPLVLLHLGLVFLLVMLFPFSKLIHIGGLLFNPTRSQVDNPRESRPRAVVSG